jgi:hypothetical protein
LQVDSCSALVEHADGNLEILNWLDHYKESSVPTPAKSEAGSSDGSDTESVVSQQASLLFDVLKLGRASSPGKSSSREY